MSSNRLDIRRFEVAAPDDRYKIEAVCVLCGEDLVVIVGGGSNYHLGALALTLSLPSIKDENKLTTSTYQIPIPRHKEETLARESSLLLSQRLKRNVVVTVGIHIDGLTKEEIPLYVQRFNELIDIICLAYRQDG